jgi:hypothetical protein
MSESLTERVKFYADSGTQINKLFCFKIKQTRIKECLFRFMDQGCNIRAAWYELINSETGEIIRNHRLPLQELKDEFNDRKFIGLLSKQRKYSSH